MGGLVADSIKNYMDGQTVYRVVFEKADVVPGFKGKASPKTGPALAGSASPTKAKASKRVEDSASVSVEDESAPPLEDILAARAKLKAPIRVGRTRVAARCYKCYEPDRCECCG